MNKNEQFVITINRELGSGGRTVGRLLAEKLGVPFYDKAVVKALQEKYNLTVEEIERMKGRKHSWWDEVERILKIDSGVNINYYLPQKDDAPDLLTTDEMFKTAWIAWPASRISLRKKPARSSTRWTRCVRTT